MRWSVRHAWVATFWLVACSQSEGVAPNVTSVGSDSDNNASDSSSTGSSVSDGGNGVASDTATGTSAASTTGDASASSAGTTTTTTTTSDPSGSSSGVDTTGSETSDTTDAPYEGHYGPCPTNDAECLDSEQCLFSGANHVCTPLCGTVADCPTPPPGSTAEVSCENPGVGFTGCFLKCQSTPECPPPMLCNGMGDCSY